VSTSAAVVRVATVRIMTCTSVASVDMTADSDSTQHFPFVWPVYRMSSKDRRVQVVEHALGLLPTKAASVLTPTETIYRGLHVNAAVCGVSIIRSGEAMESALRSCWKGIDIGKILVQRRHRANLACARAHSVCLEDGDDCSADKQITQDEHGTYYSERQCVSFGWPLACMLPLFSVDCALNSSTHYLRRDEVCPHFCGSAVPP
jgi:hypothetical protein